MIGLFIIFIILDIIDAVGILKNDFIH